MNIIENTKFISNSASDYSGGVYAECVRNTAILSFIVCALV